MDLYFTTLRLRSKTNKNSKSGIYQMKYLDFPLKYIEQTGKIFNTGYKEHILAVISNNNSSGYSNHILNTGYTNSTTTGKIFNYFNKNQLVLFNNKPWDMQPSRAVYNYNKV
jgi:hypothetical protein